jgi:hypothetical protein
MKTLLLSTPQRHVSLAEARRFVPEMPEGWQMEVSKPCATGRKRAFKSSHILPNAILARMTASTSEDRVSTWIHEVADLQNQTSTTPYVIFTFSAGEHVQRRSHAAKPKTFRERLQERIKEFKYPERVDVAWEEHANELAMRLRLIGAKLDLEPRPSPLDHVKKVMEATADLHGTSGRLSASAVAEVFGVSQSKLAEWLGRTRQAVSKTPESESLQHALSFYERTARLRARVSGEDFKKWLRMPNAQLDLSKPLDLLAEGEGQLVADLVDDMLTGSPS